MRSCNDIRRAGASGEVGNNGSSMLPRRAVVPPDAACRCAPSCPCGGNGMTWSWEPHLAAARTSSFGTPTVVFTFPLCWFSSSLSNAGFGFIALWAITCVGQLAKLPDDASAPGSVYLQNPASISSARTTTEACFRPPERRKRDDFVVGVAPCGRPAARP